MKSGLNLSCSHKPMNPRPHRRGFLCLKKPPMPKKTSDLFFPENIPCYSSMAVNLHMPFQEFSSVFSFYSPLNWWKVVQMNRILSLSLVVMVGSAVVGCSSMSDDTSPRATNGPADTNISPTGTNANNSARTAGSGTMRGTGYDGTSNGNNSTDGRVGTGGTGVSGTSQGGAGTGTGGTTTGTGGTGSGGTSTGTGSGAGSAGAGGGSGGAGK